VSKNVVATEVQRRIAAMNNSIMRVLAARPLPYDTTAPVSDSPHALDELMNQSHQRCGHCGGHIVSHDGGSTWNHADHPLADQHHPPVPAGGWFQPMPRAAVIEVSAIQQHDQRTATMRVVAHDSGDGETIYHCPFCGSGDVVGGQDGTVSCGFCKKAFTVQVQPKFKNMPQTVNGVPYNIPGMPGGGPDAGAANVGAPVPPDAQPIEDAPVDDANAGAPAPQDDSAGPPRGSDKPPWMKPSQAALLVTDTGVALPIASAMRRLALRHADDRDAVLEDVRRSHG